MIGAGIAGITAGVLLPRKVPGIQLTIFDKNSDVVSTQSRRVHRSNSNNYTREVLGSRTSTQASGVTSHRTATNRLMRLKSTGPRSMPKDRRSRTTGSQLPKSLMFTPNVASRQKSTQRNGTLKRPNGA